MSAEIDILVMTCEKYSHLIFKWLTFFKRTWTLPYQLTVVVAGPPPRYLVIPSQTQGDNIVYHSMLDGGYAANLLDFHSIQSSPFMLMMDDFMLFEADNAKLLAAWDIIQRDDVGCVRLVPWPGPTLSYGVDGFGEIDKRLEYALSLQASFWKPQTFRDLLDRSWSPWQIELEGSQRAASYPKQFIGCKTCAVNYKDYMLRGQPRPQHAEWVDERL